MLSLTLVHPSSGGDVGVIPLSWQEATGASLLFETAELWLLLCGSSECCCWVRSFVQLGFLVLVFVIFLFHALCDLAYVLSWLWHKHLTSFFRVAYAGTNSWCFVVHSWIHYAVSETLPIPCPSYNWGDAHRTEVDVLEEHFFLDCYLVYEEFQHPAMEKIILLLLFWPFLQHCPALVVPERLHMAVYLSQSGLSFPISFSIVPNPLDGWSAFLSECKSSVLAVGSLQEGQSRTGVLLAGYRMAVSLLPCGAKDAWF